MIFGSQHFRSQMNYRQCRFDIPSLTSVKINDFESKMNFQSICHFERSRFIRWCFIFWLRFAYERYVYFSIHTVSSQALFFDDFMPIRANVNIFCQNTVEVKPFGVINIYIDVFIFRKLNRESKPKNPKWRNYFYSVFLSESFSVMLVLKILSKVGQIYNRVRLHNSDINAYCILIQYTVYSYSIQHTHTVYSTLNFLGQHVNDRFALWKFQA